MESPLVSVKNVSKTFTGVKALNNIGLGIAPDEIHCLAGENGSGKSTLIRMISGIHQPNSGTIEISGRIWARTTPLEMVGAGVQVIYQDFSIFPNLTVMENLALTTEVVAGRKLVSQKRFRKIAEEAVAKIDFTVDLNAKVGELSVTDKQLVAICQALMSNAKFIVMDKPITALTKHEVDTLFSAVSGLKVRGITILFVSHKLEEVSETSERFTVLRSEEKIIICERDEFNRHRFAKYMTGKESTETRFEAGALTEEVVLETKNLCAAGTFEDASFSLKGGEILDITDLLGSEHTELALALFGPLSMISGTISVKGRNVILFSIQGTIKVGIALVPEDRLTEGLFLTRSIGENIVISELGSFTGALGVFDKKKIEREKIRWVQELEVATPNHENTVDTLSDGNQQRVVLTRWLATKPNVLILSGPTVGVDIESKHTIRSILQRLTAQGMAIVIVSDDIAEVLTNCSSVLIVRDGRICESIDPATTSEAELGELVSRDTAQGGMK